MRSLDRALTIGGSLVGAGCGFATGILIARLLGPTDRGLVASVLPIAVLLASLAGLGLPDYVLIKAAIRGTYPPVRDLLPLAGLGAVAGITTLAILAARSVGEHPSLFAIIAIPAAALPLQQIALRKLAYLQGAGRVATFAAFRTLPQLSALVAIAILWSLDAVTVLSAIAAQTIAASLPALIPIQRQAVGSLSASADAENEAWGGNVRSVAWKAWIAGLPALTIQRLDLIIVSLFIADKATVGYYAIATTLSSIPQMISQSLGLLARRRSARAAGDPTAVARTDRLIVVASVTVSMLATPIAIPTLLGPAYADAVPIAEVLLLASLPLGLATLQAEDALGKQRYRIVRRVWTWSLLVLVGTMAALIPSWGALGAAIACVLAYSVAAAMMLKSMRRIGTVSHDE